MSTGKFAKEKLGKNIHHWINNAGSVAYKRKSILDLEANDLKQVVETNMLGTMYCCKVAIDLMKSQSIKGKSEECSLASEKNLLHHFSEESLPSDTSHFFIPFLTVLFSSVLSSPPTGNIYVMDGAGVDGGATNGCGMIHSIDLSLENIRMMTQQKFVELNRTALC